VLYSITGPMRLSPDEIQYISRKIVKVLTADRRIEVDDEERVMEGIARTIVEELQVEDRLNEEVREVLVQHTQQMERSDVTYSEMFKKVKRELAKQKGIIL
jgi:hypothetical protein